MKKQFWLLHRNGVFYLKNSLTSQKKSLHTRNRRETLSLRAAHDKAAQSSALGLAFAKAYLSVHDPDFAKRAWQQVTDCFCARGKPQT